MEDIKTKNLGFDNESTIMSESLTAEKQIGDVDKPCCSKENPSDSNSKGMRSAVLIFKLAMEFFSIFSRRPFFSNIVSVLGDVFDSQNLCLTAVVSRC